MRGVARARRDATRSPRENILAVYVVVCVRRTRRRGESEINRSLIMRDGARIDEDKVPKMLQLEVRDVRDQIVDVLKDG